MADDKDSMDVDSENPSGKSSGQAFRADEDRGSNEESKIEIDSRTTLMFKQFDSFRFNLDKISDTTKEEDE